MTHLPNGAPIAAIPEALRERDQWVLWRLEPKDDKPEELTKVPYRDVNRRARANDPKTWLSFAVALERWRANPAGWSGIGYEFSADDPFTGIDFDNCIDPTTGEVAQWADRELGELLPTYAEISPSGKGLKLWVETERAHTIGSDDKDAGQIEVYSSGRFFAVTGQAFEDAPPTIEHADDDLIEQIISREQERRNARRTPQAPTNGTHAPSTNGAVDLMKLNSAYPLLPLAGLVNVLNRLHDDRWSAYDDWLRIGMALHDWGGGDELRCATARALFDQYSKERAPKAYGQVSEKWSSFGKRNGDAPDVTVGTLIRWANEDATDDPPHPAGSDRPSDHEVITPRYTVSSENELYDMPPLRYLDREMALVAGAFHLLYGASGSGKTFIAVERAMRQVALGRRVLYIATEDLSGLRYRVAAWRLAHPESSGRLTWLQMPKGLDLQEYDQVAELVETIAPYEYDHIVLDTLREAHSGDENSSQDTRRINRAIQRLIATGAAVDVIHHSGVAGERPRGSTALFSNADVVLRVESDDDLVRLTFDKLRAPPRDPLSFGLVQQDSGLIDTDGQPVMSCVIRPASHVTTRSARLTPTQRKVLETLALSIFTDTGAKAQQVIDTAEITRRHAFLALASLKNRSYITQGTKGDPYYITREGLAQLGPNLAPAPSSDLPPTAPESGSDPSDQEVISSDQHSTVSEVIHSDHTRRVITGSLTDHLPLERPEPRSGLPLASLPSDLTGEVSGMTPTEETIARLKAERDKREAAQRIT